jgi:hypothetical protein
VAGEASLRFPPEARANGAFAMDLRNPAMIRLVIVALVATVAGPWSGLAIGLFILVYEDGHRRGVLPPQPHRIPLGVRKSFPMISKLVSRLRGRQS